MTQDEIIEMAKQAGKFKDGIFPEPWLPFFVDFANLVAQHEREACAKVADKYAEGLERNYSEIIADAIRASGQA
jgi:hypothetical protein